MMDFYEVLDRVLILLQRHGRASYRALKRQFDLDDVYLEDLKNELLYTQSDVIEDGERGLIWTDTRPEHEIDVQPETDRERPIQVRQIVQPIRDMRDSVNSSSGLMGSPS